MTRQQAIARAVFAPPNPAAGDPGLKRCARGPSLRNDELYKAWTALDLYATHHVDFISLTHAIQEMMARWNRGDGPACYRYKYPTAIGAIRTPKGVLFVRTE